MLPIVVSMAAAAGTSPRRLLMPLAFASSMGGMLTLIGTPPNLVIQEHLTEGGYAPLSRSCSKIPCNWNYGCQT